MNKLTYKDGQWKLAVNGEEVSNDKLLIGSIAMDYGVLPSVTILVDEIDIDDVNVEQTTLENLKNEA